MQQQVSDENQVEIEVIKVDEKKIVLLNVLEIRIEQHDKAFALAKARIDACYELAGRIPSEANLLVRVIDTWTRIRDYHGRVLETSKRLRAQLQQP